MRPNITLPLILCVFWVGAVSYKTIVISVIQARIRSKLNVHKSYISYIEMQCALINHTYGFHACTSIPCQFIMGKYTMSIYNGQVYHVKSSNRVKGTRYLENYVQESTQNWSHVRSLFDSKMQGNLYKSYFVLSSMSISNTSIYRRDRYVIRWTVTQCIDTSLSDSNLIYPQPILSFSELENERLSY